MILQLIFIFSICLPGFLSFVHINLNVRQQSSSSSLNTLQMAGGRVPLVPYYPNKGSKDYQWMDIYNALGRKRTLFVGRFLDEEACNQLIASLIFLQGENSDKPITLYFNVPGSILKPAFAVYDVMRRMTCPLITINMGLTVGMGALLCAVGSKGKRFAFPNARFLIAKTGLEDGLQGQAVGLGLAVQEVMRDNEKVVDELSRLCGQPPLKLKEDIRRDFYLTSAEAAAYGIIDRILMPASPVKMARHRGDDDDRVRYGHFAEAQKLKSGPTEKMIDYRVSSEEDVDEFATEEMMNSGMTSEDQKTPPPSRKRLTAHDIKKGGAATRFAGARCRPPGSNKLKKKKPAPPPDENNDDGEDVGKFANTGWS